MSKENIQQGLKPGTLLRGNTYRIEKVIGQGGFGITYLATDLNLDLKVAVKEFFPKDYCDREGSTSHVTLGTRSTEEFVDRLKTKFLKEARNIAKFKNPAIIRILAAFEENNTAYYVMEYIEGSTLSEIVKTSGPIAPQQAVEYIEKVGEALEYIHAKKINHLDVKPANIMVRSSDNEPILIDFGLSKQYDREGHQTSTTPTGISHGFAPMEQYKAGGVKEFSPQTDLYSLAATLYYILTGVVPPQAPELVDENLTFPDAIPSYMVGAISKAMSSGRKQRHESVKAFLNDLKNSKDSASASADTVIVSPESKEDTVMAPAVKEAAVKKPQPPQLPKSTEVKNEKVQPAAEVKPAETKTPKKEPTPKPAPEIKAPVKKQESKTPKPEVAPKPVVPRKEQKGWKKWYTYGIILATAVVVGIVVILFALPQNKDNGKGADSDIEASATADAAAEAPEAPATVSNAYWESPLGPASYTGTVADNNCSDTIIPDGKGVARIVSGKYEGCVYDGEFVNGKMDGETTYTCKNGDVFKGKFRDNRYDEGRYIMKENGYYFVGKFTDSQPDKGQWYDENGNKL